MLNSKTEAFEFVKSLDAPSHLLTHVTLVGEAADLLINKCEQLLLKIDPEFVRVGVIIHDVGKIKHPNEMSGPGSEHEPSGERLLLEKGISEKIARCCLSHARWDQMECSIEELLIALSDKLWKGKRVEQLELLVIDRISTMLDKERWDIYQELDSHFELIASSGDQRLERSMIPSIKPQTT